MILTAQEAKQLTFNNIENGETEELKMILELIDKAIKNGEYNISGDGNLRYNTVERFKELGYNVKNEFVRNETYWNISWKNIKGDL